jgi:hypothetical protein
MSSRHNYPDERPDTTVAIASFRRRVVLDEALIRAAKLRGDDVTRKVRLLKSDAMEALEDGDVRSASQFIRQAWAECGLPDPRDVQPPRPPFDFAARHRERVERLFGDQNHD